MKKTISMLLAFILVLASGCAESPASAVSGKAGDTLIVFN